MSANTFGGMRDIPANNETNVWTTPIRGSCSQVCHNVFWRDSLKMFYFRHYGVFQI